MVSCIWFWWCSGRGLRTGSIEVVITNEKSQTKSTGTSAAAAAAAFSMADRIRRLSSDEFIRMSGLIVTMSCEKFTKSFEIYYNWGEFELMFHLSCDRKVLYLEPSRKQDFLMKLHIPVVDKRKKRLNRSCSVLTKAGWIRRQSWVTVMTSWVAL